jgi:hypothetical protein
VALGLGLTVALAAFAQAPAPEDDLVLVRRVVDTRYTTPQAWLSPLPAQPVAPLTGPVDWKTVRYREALPFSAALASQVSREAPVREGETLQGIVLREYGFGQKDSKDAYAAMERRILDLNGLARPEDLRAGQSIQVPALPPVALSEPGSHNAYNALPKTSFYASLSKAASGALDKASLTYRTPPSLSALQRKGAPLVAEYIWLPREQVARERALAGEAADAIQVHAETVRATLYDGPAPSAPGPFLTAEEKALLQARIAMPAKQAPVLIVLDDGWPDDKAFAESVQWLAAAFRAVEQKFKYPGGRNVQALGANPTTSFPVEAFHARSIAQALQPLTALDDGPQKRVKVVYLPLTKAQRHAAGVLSDLITLRLLDDWAGATRGDERPPQREVDRMRKAADEIVARLPTDIGQREVKTDKAVIESVLLLADLYSRASGNAYVVNFSWTTPKLQNRYADMRFNLGLVVAAAGNQSAPTCFKCRPHLAHAEACKCADNVAAAERWFAVRAVDGQDVIAVMNTARDGSLQCRSSIVATQGNGSFSAVAADGTVSATTCGTSFSAPRVAWLGALKLAYVDPATLYSMEVARGPQLRSMILDARSGGGDRDDQFTLDVKKLFNN